MGVFFCNIVSSCIDITAEVQELRRCDDEPGKLRRGELVWKSIMDSSMAYTKPHCNGQGGGGVGAYSYFPKRKEVKVMKYVLFQKTRLYLHTKSVLTVANHHHEILIKK